MIVKTGIVVVERYASEKWETLMLDMIGPDGVETATIARLVTNNDSAWINDTMWETIEVIFGNPNQIAKFLLGFSPTMVDQMFAKGDMVSLGPTIAECVFLIDDPTESSEDVASQWTISEPHETHLDLCVGDYLYILDESGKWDFYDPNTDDPSPTQLSQVAEQYNHSAQWDKEKFQNGLIGK